MGYGSKKGRRPIERASKIAHAEIINTSSVAAFLKNCTLPSVPADVSLEQYVYPVETINVEDIKAVVAIDGGFTETHVREEFPSASIAFFTFGPLLFKLADLRQLDSQRFIAPEDLAKLKNLERHNLTLPTKGVRLTSEPSFAASVRRTIYDFFIQPGGPHEDPLIKSLQWFLFGLWKPAPDPAAVVDLTRCPNPLCSATALTFRTSDPTVYPCPKCGRNVYLTDVFRLHERIDEEQGSSAITTQVMTLLEQIVLIHIIHSIWRMKRSLLKEIFFIKDGPLAFFDVVAPLYRPMRELTAFLSNQQAYQGLPGQPYLYLAGAVKSGAFVDHATQIEAKLPPNSVLIPNNGYIYRYIVPGDSSADNRFGHNTYYGQYVFFKSASGDMHVLTVPTRVYTPNPTPADFPNLNAILQLVSELRCSMYDNALIPIALANKLVSLSDVPSQRLLTTFAVSHVDNA